MPARHQLAGRIAGGLALLGTAVFATGAVLAPMYGGRGGARSLWHLVILSENSLQILSPLLVILALALGTGAWLLASPTTPRLPSGILLGSAGGGLAILAQVAAVTVRLGGQGRISLGWGAAVLFAGILCILAAGVLAAYLHAGRRAVVGVSVAVAAIAALPLLHALAGVDIWPAIVVAFGALAAGAIILLAAGLWRAIASRTPAAWPALLGAAGFAAASVLPAAGFSNGRPGQVRSYALLDLDAPASAVVVLASLPAIMVGLVALGTILVAGRERAQLGAGLLVGAALPAMSFVWSRGAGLEFLLSGFWVALAATALSVLAAILALRDRGEGAEPATEPDAAPA